MSAEYKGPLTKAAEMAVTTFARSEANSDQYLYDAVEADIWIAVEVLLKNGGENVRIKAANLLGTMRQQERVASNVRKFGR